MIDFYTIFVRISEIIRFFCVWKMDWSHKEQVLSNLLNSLNKLLSHFPKYMNLNLRFIWTLQFGFTDPEVEGMIN